MHFIREKTSKKSLRNGTNNIEVFFASIDGVFFSQELKRSGDLSILAFSKQQKTRMKNELTDVRSEKHSNENKQKTRAKSGFNPVS